MHRNAKQISVFVMLRRHQRGFRFTDSKIFFEMAGNARGFSLSLALECPSAFPFPKHERLFAFLTAKLGRNGQERAIERGAIIIGEFNQPGFHDEATQFDKMPRAFAAMHSPFAHVGSRLLCFKPIPRRCHSA